MKNTPETVRTLVKRAHAETYLLIMLVAFAGAVIATRLFLELTGYPQLGNSVLHIAHALWGGLLLILAALIPLVVANHWARILSAVLSGLGVGLFIDEVGKFITQQNDYFFPPAAPLVYALFLLLLLLLFFVRRRRDADPRAEMYRALTSLSELVDNNLDTRELEALLNHLGHAQQSPQPQIAGLATAIHTYLLETPIPLLPATPSLWKRFTAALERGGRRIGRRPHRWVILLSMAVLSVGMVMALVLPLLSVVAPEPVGEGLVTWLVSGDDVQTAGSRFWFYLRLTLEGIVGCIALVAIYWFARGKEPQGARAALVALLISLTGVVLLSFYLDQFSATVTALVQLGVLLVVQAYRWWYLQPMIQDSEPV
ncbi:MAG: hypothetical protein PVJ23_09655 [Anaerolineae bacterium]|jgi:hypothetical protein